MTWRGLLASANSDGYGGCMASKIAATRSAWSAVRPSSAAAIRSLLTASTVQRPHEVGVDHAPPLVGPALGDRFGQHQLGGGHHEVDEADPLWTVATGPR
ncbi:hypothetical protein MOQ72_20910 [Saccharopolyspora sp. K220]|uniref:hypothetical protein n=1 Tax=Saccharopolyspora soli TaxID=2926618 RepID=UPI001F58BA5B|nr:hypothetical protein [Saccharopolyspora soli]MCI2419912.1 hypothetical protein [Saccharopolyspora soli]